MSQKEKEEIRGIVNELSAEAKRRSRIHRNYLILPFFCMLRYLVGAFFPRGYKE